ncbi:3-oxoacyl-[acyl-carrier-protein] reductase FabG [Stieleria neptunia]|uniref:3-oxoacyl-[acyl-carrier-protein] reductase FabG n=1 Tax=Stieleria neptunia TaxID=2527979 RepID=A0A518I4I9_9BACT|nr:glucose 1-dehydrogenase [Stieleria neptunia]QDV47948.1 3-oxoacyl-[acyl-carrier-protein] reductase FabG [Stieleria neptunia]
MTEKVAIVTGASRGIGAATATLLGRNGYRVAVNYRQRSDAADSVVAQIVAGGGDAFAVQADVSDENQIKRLFASVDDRWGRLDALVNNAGILQPQTPVQSITAERLNRILAVNVFGPFLCCREALQRMKTGGNIVNVSSIASRTGSPHEYVDYAASKGAIDSLTIGLAKEVAGRGIRVNAVRPGIIETEIHADGGEPGRAQRIGATLPLGRAGRSEDVAEAILWLLSDRSSFTTGQFIDVAGGIAPS